VENQKKLEVEVARNGEQDQDQEHDDECVHVAISFLGGKRLGLLLPRPVEAFLGALEMVDGCVERRDDAS
jgi:hypothetical protein